MSNIKVFCPNLRTELLYKSFVFPGGEVGVKFETEYPRPLNTRHRITITLKAKEAKDLIELAMVKDAVERTYNPPVIDLVLPYIPYARQDRVCDKGEAFSLKVFANYLNFLNFNSVTVYDPHSDVSPALIDRVVVVKQESIIKEFNWLYSLLRYDSKAPVLVSPDMGASKKVGNVALAVGHTTFIKCDKLRDLTTGKIIETKVYAENSEIEGTDFLILDDICDGGATFIELAKVLKAKGARRVALYVTHGIFSRGVEALLDNGIDEVFTTNSLINAEDLLKLERFNPRVKVFDLFNP